MLEVSAISGRCRIRVGNKSHMGVSSYGKSGRGTAWGLAHSRFGEIRLKSPSGNDLRRLAQRAFCASEVCKQSVHGQTNLTRT
ncbi:MAG: hypothetical protein AB7K24_21270, partial [Gemmataceae bacterium]